MVEVFHHKVKTVLLPNLKKYGLIEEDEEAKLLQVENDRRIVVESLITIRGKTDFYFILEKILKNLGLNAALKNMYNLLHKGIDGNTLA